VLIYKVASAPAQVNTPAREPIRVDPAKGQTLRHALQRARPGDRILLLGDIREANVAVRTRDITIEADKPIVWRCPERVAADSKLLLLGNAANFTLRNITLDGDNKASTLINIYGHCSGALFKNLTFQGQQKYGLLITNAEGSSESPIVLSGLRFVTNKPDQIALAFGWVQSISKLPTGIPRSRYFNVQDCTFKGPGDKVRVLKATDSQGKPVPRDRVVDPKTLTLPSDVQLLGP
jgi:hypothetical protein